MCLKICQKFCFQSRIKIELPTWSLTHQDRLERNGTFQNFVVFWDHLISRRFCLLKFEQCQSWFLWKDVWKYTLNIPLKMGKNQHLGWFSWFDVIFSNAFMDSEEFELLDSWETEELCWAWVEVDAAFKQTYSGLKFVVLAGFLVEREGTHFSILNFPKKSKLAKCIDSL